MTELKIQDRNPVEILNMVYDLRQQGASQGIDFDFEFHSGEYDEYNVYQSSYTVFKFYTEAWSSWFLLRAQ